MGQSVYRNILLIIGAFIAFVYLQSCLSSVDFTEDAVELRFSVDTLKFDTVFTARGTATRHFKIFNPESKAVKTTVQLGKRTAFFRMNVDGYPGDKIEDIEILARDSIYVFVEAIIDPNQPLSISPFIVEDNIIISTNGVEQKVHLEAFGQDAIYLTPDSYQGKQVYLSCDMGDVLWEDERPFILNGILVIDSCTLNLAPGTKLYVHGGVQKQGDAIYNDGAILVLKHGQVKAIGNPDNWITIGGDRLESEFENVAGQWNGIRFLEGSKGNSIENCLIKDAIIGLMVDSLSELDIHKSIIRNSAMTNLYSLAGNVTSSNSLFANSGETSVILNGGGNYDFTYVTIGNHGTGSNGLFLSNLYPIGQDEFVYFPINLNIRNSLISAGISDAFAMSLLDREYKEIDITIQDTGIKSKELTEGDYSFPDFYEHFNTAFRIETNDRLFINPVGLDYRLDSLSIAADKALPLLGFSDDIIGNQRDPASPSAGCYEYEFDD